MARLRTSWLVLIILLAACEGPEFNPPPEIPIRGAEGTEEVLAIQRLSGGVETKFTVHDRGDEDVSLRLGDDGCEENVEVLEIRRSRDSQEVLDSWALSEWPLCRGDRLLWTGNELKLVDDAS